MPHDCAAHVVRAILVLWRPLPQRLFPSSSQRRNRQLTVQAHTLDTAGLPFGTDP